MQSNQPHPNGAYWGYPPHPSYSAYPQSYQRSPWQPEAPVAQQYLTLRSDHCSMTVQQHPEECLVTLENKEKTRKTIDPPPIVEFFVSRANDPNQYFMSCPNVFCYVALVDAETHTTVKRKGKPALTGTFVSSIHKLKDSENKGDGGYFVFPDISCREVGTWKLRFTVMEINPAEPGQLGGGANNLGEVFSNTFQVLQAKDFKGVAESTYLSRAFSDQGVRIRLRKEPRSGKRSFDEREDHRTPPQSNANPYTPTEEDGNSAKRTRYSGDFDSVSGSGGLSVDAYSSQGLAVRPPSAHTYLSPPSGNVYPASTLQESTEIPYSHMHAYNGYGGIETHNAPGNGLFSNGHNPFGEPLGHGMRTLEYGIPTSNGIMSSFGYPTPNILQTSDDRSMGTEGYPSLPVQPTVSSSTDSQSHYCYSDEAFGSDDHLLDTTGFEHPLAETLFPIPKSHYSEKVARARDDLLQAAAANY